MRIERYKLVGNSLSLLTSRIVQSLTAFILLAAIGRIRGPYEVGQYTLALSYYFIFITVASQGYKLLITRELSRNPDETPLYLGNSTLVQMLLGVIAYAALWGVVSLFPYSSDTAQICYVVGLAIIPFSLSNVTEAIFQSQEKAQFITMSTVPIYLVRVALYVVAMQMGYGVLVVAWIQVLSEFIILFLEWILITRSVKPIWRINRQFVVRSIKAARFLIAIEGLAIFQSRVQVLILSVLAGEVVVGLYGVVMQMLQPFQIITQSVITAIFPRLSNSDTMIVERQQRLIKQVIEVLLLVALPLAVVLFFVGGQLLVFIYSDPRFAEATLALRVVAIGMIAQALIRPLSYLLVANRLEYFNVREVVLTTILGALFSIPLIMNYQLMGAAMAMALVHLLALAQYVYGVHTLVFPLKVWDIWDSARRPLGVSVLLTIVLVMFIH